MDTTDAKSIASILALLVILGLAALEDLKEKRVSNRLIVFGLILCFLMAWGGFLGVTFLVVLRNILIPVICLYLFFLVGVIGAGDIKLFSIVSGFMGLNFVKQTIFLSFAIGACWSLIWLLKNHLFYSKMTKAFSYLQAISNGERSAYSSDSTIAFSVCIFLAASFLLLRMVWGGV